MEISFEFVFTIIRQNPLWTNRNIFNSNSLYGAILGMTIMYQVRARGKPMPEQVKEIKKTQKMSQSSKKKKKKMFGFQKNELKTNCILIS